MGRYLNLKLIQQCSLVLGFLLLLSGCLSEPGKENNSTSEIDNDWSVRPSVLCGEGRAVQSVDSLGDVQCGSTKLNGQAAQVKKPDDPAACESDQTLRWETVLGKYGELQIPLCDDEVEESKDDVTLGSAPTLPFNCPNGSVLKGFSPQGEPICAALVSAELSEMAYLMDDTECPWGLNLGRMEHSDFTLPSCLVDSNRPREMKLVDQKVARYNFQFNKICPGDKIVIGFDGKRQIICGQYPQHLKRPPRRYWVTKYDGHVENPICKPGYNPVATYLKWSNTAQRPAKIWTCQRGG